MRGIARSLWSGAGAAARQLRSPSAPAEQLRAVRIHAYGAPSHGLRLDTLCLPDPDELAAESVLVRMEAAPINPSDVNVAEGVYPIRFDAGDLPAVAGNEGAGEVVAVGKSVTRVRPGDRVLPALPLLGTWATHMVAPQDALHKAPYRIPWEYAACMAVNPITAWRMLEDYVTLRPGDVVVQNCANSMVGLCIVQLCALRGVHTVNIVRGARPDLDEVTARIKHAGGDVVLPAEHMRSSDPLYKSVLADLPAPPRLALDGAGGSTAAAMVRMLAPGASLVTYGGMSRRGLSISASAAIWRDIHTHGFWLSRWRRETDYVTVQTLLDQIGGLMEARKLSLFVEAHDFSLFPEAFARHIAPFRQRKVVLRMTDAPAALAALRTFERTPPPPTKEEILAS